MTVYARRHVVTCCGTTDISSPPIRPHHGRAHQLTLVTSAGKDCVQFKVAVQTYRALHGDAPQYLRQFTPVADIPSRQKLRSSTSDDLCVPAVRLPTVGRRAFSVAGARVWNALPADVTSAPSLFTFRKRLKLHLFPLSYPGLVL